MAMTTMRVVLCLAAVAALAACTNDDLRRLNKPGEGPDEFSVMPSKPLEQPDNYSVLPTPTPGGENLADRDPRGEAVVALGGRPAAPGGAVPAADGTLVAYAGRFGMAPNIRAVVEQEDDEFRERRGRFTGLRLFKVDRYAEVYEPQALDQRRELQRWRRAGARTPSVPVN